MDWMKHILMQQRCCLHNATSLCASVWTHSMNTLYFQHNGRFAVFSLIKKKKIDRASVGIVARIQIYWHACHGNLCTFNGIFLSLALALARSSHRRSTYMICTQFWQSDYPYGEKLSKHAYISLCVHALSFRQQHKGVSIWSIATTICYFWSLTSRT